MTATALENCLPLRRLRRSEASYYLKARWGLSWRLPIESIGTDYAEGDEP
jgi:hypothetical protein